MINLNGVGWRVLLVPSGHPDLMRQNGTFTLGCCDNDQKTIFIDENLNLVYLKKVLCHELVHACMFSYGVELEEAQEELLADLIATYGDEIISTTNTVFARLSTKNK